MAVCGDSSSTIMLAWVGSRCWTRMKAMPLFGGKRREEGTKGFKPAGGGADRDHREVGLALRDHSLLRSAQSSRPGVDW